MSTQRGFTLVELMVVTVIIIVLASFVFLGTTRLRSATDKAQSVDNLRKLQLANGLYASDNNGRFVACYTKNEKGNAGGIWDRNSDFLDLYIGVNQPTEGNSQESRVSPKHLDAIAYKARAAEFDTLKASYGMVSKEDYTSSEPGTESSYRLTELTSPSQTASFVTAVNWLVQYSGRSSWKGVEGKVNAPMMAYRHRGKALVAYYDGHVGEITMDDMTSLDARGGKKNSFWMGTNGRR
ncbi:type II secretion system protein [Haloferula chungangensis]|uniref:Type II secretion system protein n=1 Tax=Haloferula chungangensis TaxID=1048331 RepID=A0ABW2L5C9_9BACT